MSKISDLEKEKLAELFKILVPVKNSYTDNEDSIQDFICKQFEITTDEPDVLEAARKHLEIEQEAMLEAFEIINLLVTHFDV